MRYVVLDSDEWAISQKLNRKKFIIPYVVHLSRPWKSSRSSILKVRIAIFDTYGPTYVVGLIII